MSITPDIFIWRSIAIHEPVQGEECFSFSSPGRNGKPTIAGADFRTSVLYLGDEKLNNVEIQHIAGQESLGRIENREGQILHIYTNTEK